MWYFYSSDNNNLSGTIPSDLIGNLQLLTGLSFYGNSLTGTIPTEFTNGLQYLEHLFLGKYKYKMWKC